MPISRAVLTHNKNEEIEHAMMTLEWIRRHNPVFDTNLKTYLNTTGPITEVEKQPRWPAVAAACGVTRRRSASVALKGKR